MVMTMKFRAIGWVALSGLFAVSLVGCAAQSSQTAPAGSEQAVVQTEETQGPAAGQAAVDEQADAATAEQNWNDYAAEVEALDWNHGGRYPETRAPEEFASYTWPYYLSTRPDYRLMLQNSSLMESSCPFIADRLAAMKMESVQPYELLTALPEASKQQFYRMAKFDYARFAGLFDLSPKKNLIIIGTSHSSAASEQQQAAYVERIIQQYGSDYDIFFKPHPADSSSAGYPDRFEGLTLLPGQMPFEIFVWALLDKIDMIGGYPSTTFISVPLDKVGFLFAADADGLVRPLNILFRDAANVEWIQ